MVAQKKNDGPKRILIVDDDKFLLEFFGRILTAQGYVSILASNGHDAKDILENEEKAFDMIILDLLMPVQSGWKLLEFLKEHDRYSKTPVIVMTGLSLTYDEFERIKDDCASVLLKGDFEISRFSAIIEENLV
jgi:DNA-binding response OmpR family regulator